MNATVLCFILFAIVVNGLPQVPYDYVPIGRRDSELGGPNVHPSDIKHVYETLYPSRKKWADSKPEARFVKNKKTKS